MARPRDVADVNAQVQSELSALMGRFGALSGAWKGSAAVSFQALAVRWNENARKLNDALADISAAIATSGQVYRRLMRRSSRVFWYLQRAGLREEERGHVGDFGYVFAIRRVGPCGVVGEQPEWSLSDLKSYLAPLVSTWTGAAAENYNAKQRHGMRRRRR
jgi:WXG100 family type VII secretion target